jgi:hypothetical protein
MTDEHKEKGYGYLRSLKCPAFMANSTIVMIDMITIVGKISLQFKQFLHRMVIVLIVTAEIMTQLTVAK